MYMAALNMAWFQVPTNVILMFPFSFGQGKENIMKGLWTKIKAGRDYSLITITGKTNSTWGKFLHLLPFKSEKDNEKQTQILIHLSPTLLFFLSLTVFLLFNIHSSVAQGTGNEGGVQFMTHCLFSFFLMLQCGVLHKLQVDISITPTDLHGLHGHSLPHYDLRHGLQRNACSTAWTTSSPPTALTLVSADILSIISSAPEQ